MHFIDASGNFNLRVQHREQFVKIQIIEYQGEKNDFVENIDADFFGLFNLEDMVRRLKFGERVHIAL